MTIRYTPPTISRNLTGLLNKHGAARIERPLDRIDGVAVADLVRDHGSPLFVFSEETLRRKYRDLTRAFTTRYPKVQPAWSYKTNYLDAICRVFHSEGSWAEVVSDFEYEKKPAGLDIPGNQIIFNGPYKSFKALQRAAAEGCKIQIDNAQEITYLERIARESGRTIPVAIRVSMETGFDQAWRKFGFNYESGEALRAIRRIASGGGLKLVGLHAHIGTFILEPRQYANAVKVLLKLATEARQQFGFTLEYLNLGGGFASSNTLHNQYFPSGEVNPTFTQYAEAICDELHHGLLSDRPQPTLFLETGRALVDEAGYLLTTVLDSRRSGEGRQSVIIDAGVNLLYAAAWYKFQVRPAQEHRDPMMPTRVYGPLCMNIDVVRDDAPLPPLSAGDQLVVHPVGAYNITQSMQFITYRPAIVLIGNGGQVDVIRRGENLEHIVALEELPERLRDQDPKAGSQMPGVNGRKPSTNGNLT